MERKFVNIKEIQRCCQSKGIVYINAPIRDNDPQHYIKRAPDVLKIVEELFKANHKIYIHCTAGIGRAPQTALLHLILHREMPL
jgi:protein-tyrosine phosphatase